jgi:glycosyltransferase involved in cell wall biosynthesis
VTPVRVGFVSGRFVHMDGGGAFVDAGMGRLIDALSARASRFTAALATAPARHALHDHRLGLAAADLIALPEMPSVARGVGKFVPCWRAIREVERRSDVLIVQLPFTAPIALLGARKPRVYNVCADVRAVVGASTDYAGAKRVLADGMAWGMDRMHAHLLHAPATATVANGNDLLARYQPVRGQAVVSSTIRAREIASVARTRPANAPFRVLFVGYLRPEKGVDTLLAAFERLLALHPDAELHVVGAQPLTERGAGTAAGRAFAELARRARVTFTGSLAFGPALFQCFADADVLVVPSRSEGTPRVLVEARSFGCPVIASRVGGIPTSIEDGVDGLLVPPGDPVALAGALATLARDAALRARLIEGGLARARRTTVDAFAQTMIDEAARLLADAPAKERD